MGLPVHQGGALNSRTCWLLGIGGATLLLGLGLWLRLADVPAYRLMLRLFADQDFLKGQLQAAGALAPLLFITLQALQVVIAPIPGEVTGFLGGFVFGEWLGFVYSMIGLTAGSLAAFGVGRWLGVAFVRRVVQPQVWQRLGFIVEAEGAILCFVIYLIPGFPKDLVCYLFGLSPMPFWVFAVVSTLGRVPGTWVLSTQGATTATGHYLGLALLTALATAVAVPLYYYREQIAARIQGRTERQKPAKDPRERE